MSIKTTAKRRLMCIQTSANNADARDYTDGYVQSRYRPNSVGTSVPINYEGGRIASHRATRKLSIRSLGRDFQRGYRLHDRGRLGPIKHAVESREAPDIFIRQCIPQSCRIHNWCRTETCRLPHAEPKLPRTTRCIHLVGIDRATRQPRVGGLFGSCSHQLPRQSQIL